MSTAHAATPSAPTVTIESIAARFSLPQDTDDCEIDASESNDLSNAVWEAVCGLSDEEFDAIADLDLDPDGAPANGSRAQYLYPQYADCTALGEFRNLQAAQALMQEIFNEIK